MAVMSQSCLENMPSRKLEGAWLVWLQENIDRKCDPEQLLAILSKNGFSPKSIQAHMESSSSNFTFLKDAAQKLESQIDYAAISKVRITRADCGLNVQQATTPKLQLYTLDGFMNDEECDCIVEISSRHLRPSTLTTCDVGYRTSNTSDLSMLNDPYVAKVAEKIAKTLGIRQSCSEGIEAQRYDAGQEFKAHTDYFQPGTDEYTSFAGDHGQRTWTFMVYLNEGMKGGGTKFFAIDKVFTPRKGMAVIWNNLYEDGSPNPDTLHSGLPVESGYKTIITQWFRDRGTHPMFYD